MSPEEVRRAVESLRAVGGVYEYVAACVEYDNQPEPGALSDSEIEGLACVDVKCASPDLNSEGAL